VPSLPTVHYQDRPPTIGGPLPALAHPQQHCSDRVSLDTRTATGAVETAGRPSLPTMALPPSMSFEHTDDRLASWAFRCRQMLAIQEVDDRRLTAEDHLSRPRAVRAPLTYRSHSRLSEVQLDGAKYCSSLPFAVNSSAESLSSYAWPVLWTEPLPDTDPYVAFWRQRRAPAPPIQIAPWLSTRTIVDGKYCRSRAPLSTEMTRPRYVRAEIAVVATHRKDDPSTVEVQPGPLQQGRGFRSRWIDPLTQFDVAGFSCSVPPRSARDDHPRARRRRRRSRCATDR